MPSPPAPFLLAPLPTPWGGPRGTPCGSGLSRYPGPVTGEITATWTPPASATLSSGPIVTTDGRVVVATDEQVVFLEPGTLLPSGRVEMAHARIAAAADDGVLATGPSGAYRIGADRKPLPMPFAPAWTERPPRRLFDLESGQVLALGDQLVAIVEPGGGIVALATLLGRVSPAIAAMALAPDGRLYVGAAASWSSPDEDTEYAGHAIELALPGLKIQWQVQSAVVTRVTGTGSGLRFAAVAAGLLLVEHGALVLSGRGKVLAELAGEALAKPPLVVDGGFMFHGKGRPVAIARTRLPEASGDPTSSEVLFTLESGESLYDLVGAGSNHLYAATSQRLLALTRDGELVWEMPGCTPYELACGNGCLFALHLPLRISRIG